MTDNKPRPKVTEEKFLRRIDEVEEYRNKLVEELNKLKAEDVDLSNDRELERAAFLVDRLSKKIIDVERVLLRHIEYEDSEYNVESLKASRIDYNRMASKERLIIIFCQYEPLNVMITDFINNPEIDKDDYYRRINIREIHQMVKKIVSENSCPLLNDFYTEDEKDPRFTAYTSYLVEIMGRVNKRITCTINAESIELNPDKLHDRCLQKIKDVSGILAARLGPVDEADGSDEDDIDDLQKTDLEKLETTYDDLKQPNDGSNEGCGPAEVHVHPIENLQIEDTNDVRGNEDVEMKDDIAPGDDISANKMELSDDEDVIILSSDENASDEADDDIQSL